MSENSNSPSIKRIKLTLNSEYPLTPVSHSFLSPRISPYVLTPASTFYSPQFTSTQLFGHQPMQSGMHLYNNAFSNAFVGQLNSPFSPPVNYHCVDNVHSHVPYQSPFQFTGHQDVRPLPLTPQVHLDKQNITPVFKTPSITEQKARDAIQQSLNPNSILMKYWAIHSIVNNFIKVVIIFR